MPSLNKDRPAPEQPDAAVEPLWVRPALGSAAVEPLWVRPALGMRLIGCKTTKFYALMNTGAIESRRVGGMRLISYESLKRLGAGADDGAGS